MTVDPRAALDRLIAALEAHYTAVAAPHGEATPFYLAEEDDDEDEDDEDDEDYDDADVDDLADEATR